MSGHSKWSKVKNFKGKIDAVRARGFSRFSKEITMTAKAGGGDPNFNPRLRTAIATAKAGNMPNENIERAIKKGTGELEGVHYEELLYEGYAPSGVALIVELLTDNKNRAAADIRRIFTKHGGNLAAPGSVSYLFKRCGVIQIDKTKVSEDDLLTVALEAGAEDVKNEEENYEIITPTENFDAVIDALRKKNLEPLNARINFLPQTSAPVSDEATARKVLELIDALDEYDDTQHVHSNFDIPDAILEKV